VWNEKKAKKKIISKLGNEFEQKDLCLWGKEREKFEEGYLFGFFVCCCCATRTLEKQNKPRRQKENKGQYHDQNREWKSPKS